MLARRCIGRLEMPFTRRQGEVGSLELLRLAIAVDPWATVLATSSRWA